jgi:hypothetical protein
MTEKTFDITAEGAAALGTKLTQAFNPRAVKPGARAAPEPDEEWTLENERARGKAWVWRVPGNTTLTEPVIIADGFSGGASSLGEWAGLWEQSQIDEIHPWGTQLHERGRDVIVLGYDSRSAPIRDNAQVARQCIMRAAQERTGSTPLVVGGLSMGGLVTRYALLQMETQRIHHQVRTYFSFDSPHRGAWIPISLQTFAHFLADLANSVEDEEKKRQMKAMSNLINSTAARELLWKHTATHKDLDTQFGPDPARDNFVRDLEAMGSYPQLPRKLGVANGRGDGQGDTTVTPGEQNLDWPRQPLPPPYQIILGPGATLYAQKDANEQLVATLKGLFQIPVVKTSEIPALDCAPGGTLNSFGIAAEALRDAGYEATVKYPNVCFVPVASAVDLADPSDPYAPVNNMEPNDSGLDEFKVASDNEGHTLLTKELCDWLTERF